MNQALTLLFSLVINISILFYIWTDFRYYNRGDMLFTKWQIPSLLILLFFVETYLIYLLFIQRNFRFVILTLLLALFISFLPYEKFGDFKRLRDISSCEGDGRRCLEGLYSYITEDWCLKEGYRFEDKTKICNMRVEED